MLICVPKKEGCSWSGRISSLCKAAVRQDREWRRNLGEALSQDPNILLVFSKGRVNLKVIRWYWAPQLRWPCNGAVNRTPAAIAGTLLSHRCSSVESSMLKNETRALILLKWPSHEKNSTGLLFSPTSPSFPPYFLTIVEKVQASPTYCTI